ncbi:murein L,D-transpeptidase catalytic domain family protein [uncultured Mucilaginibacter sp.]|uniref:murein L,D-transpeptidase catalytic domain family protein n=1 Tax=uncultured Mucilaginibacter sp. TaxID=797541 RepID=UPI0025DC3619|nr:murein L,D-transpeptidase catalytic domain family protein [uncultured Mucilaginibacter sp.]
MKKHFVGLLCILLVIAITSISWKPASAFKAKSFSKNYAAKTFSASELLEKYVDNIYESSRLEESGLAFNVFKKAITGFLDLKAADKLPQQSSILTVVDFTKSSCEKRMWIIDVVNKALVLHTWVAHGTRSGDDIPNRFSDRIDSKQSSLGFFVTDDIYYGHHGRSLKLDGMDAGFNTNARTREIVVHGAEYVNPGIIENKGRLGRSFGCPAVSTDVIDQVIDTIQGKTVLFINGDSKKYNSRYLDEQMAASYISSDATSNITASL